MMTPRELAAIGAAAILGGPALFALVHLAAWAAIALAWALGLAGAPATLPPVPFFGA